VNLLRKKSPPTDAAVVIEKDGGKGRPTPKRSDAVASRPVQPYLRTKASGGGKRSGSTSGGSSKDARRAEFQRTRAALKTGDTRPLPARDQGPERQLARDLVDARSAGVLQYFVLIAVISLASAALPNKQLQFSSTLLTLIFALAAVLDGILLTRRIGSRVDEKFPGTGVRVKLYSVQRAVLPRRFRLPPPRFRRGDTV
jgi:hypothetical protein